MGTLHSILCTHCKWVPRSCRLSPTASRCRCVLCSAISTTPSWTSSPPCTRRLTRTTAACCRRMSWPCWPRTTCRTWTRGSCDFYEFVATRSGNLTNVTAASAGAMDDAISAIVKRHAAFGADGGIDKAGLEAVLKGEDLVGDAERLFAALDADNSTSLSVSELGGIKGAIINRAKGTRAFKSAVTAFARADSDHNGELTLSEAGYVVPDSWTDTLGASAFSDMDLDGDGVCTFTEFAGAAMSQSAVHAASNFSKGAIEKTDDGSALLLA